MTAVRPLPPVRVNRLAYSGLASTVVVWMAAIHGIGWLAGQYFSLRIGFHPVWFLECTTCLPRGGWLPTGWPLVGGMSVWLVAAVVVAAVLARGRRTGMDGSTFRALAMAGAVAMAVFAALALDTRYPGSLPSVIVAVLPAAVAALSYGAAAAAPFDGVVAAREPDPLTPWSRSAAGLGALAMALLGGLVSVAAIGVSLAAYGRATDSRNRRAAVAGLILGSMSFILRWNLSGRYPWLGIWG